MPSACGTISSSACVADGAPSKKPPCTHEVVIPSRQKAQVPSDQANGTITVSPGLSVVTSAPTSWTTPMASWPIRRPSGVASRSWYGCRSEPHTQAYVTRTSASVGAEIVGSGTSSTRTSPALYIRVALMGVSFLSRWVCCSAGRRRQPAKTCLATVTAVMALGQPA